MKEPIPTPEHKFPLFAHEIQYPGDLSTAKSLVAGQTHGLQPNLRNGLATLHMDVRRFRSIAGVEEEAETF
jgi:hypothetical protein